MTADEIIAMARLTTMVDSGEISDAQMLTFINAGIYDVCMRDNWEFLQANTTFTTVAAQAAYDSTDWVSGEELQEVLFLTITGKKRPLYPISYPQAMARWGDDAPDGEPDYWYLFQEELVLVPTPESAQVVKLTYVRPPAELTDGADEPPWLTTYHGILVDYVEMRIWMQQEDFQKAAAAAGRYNDRLDTMRRAYQSRVNVGPWAVGANRSPYSGVNDPYRDDWSYTN